MNVPIEKRSAVKLVLIAFAACLLYGISSGIRANYGILINGISQSSGVPYSSVNFILALARFKQITVSFLDSITKKHPDSDLGQDRNFIRT